MPIPSGFTIVTAPCLFGAAVEYVTGLFGPPAPGNRYTCSPLPRAGPLVLASLVREVPLVAGTYLLQTVHTRQDGQDPAVTTTHYRWSGAEDPATADFEHIEARHDVFWNGLSADRSALVYQGEYRWYGPRDTPGIWGEAIRVQATTAPDGDATAGLPQQVACSLTLETDVRRRWGRFYIPCLSSTTLDGTRAGLFSAVFQDRVADLAEVCFLQSHATWRVVVFGTPTPTSLEVRNIRVDNVPDVIRKRRWEGGTTMIRDVSL